MIKVGCEAPYPVVCLVSFQQRLCALVSSLSERTLVTLRRLFFFVLLQLLWEFPPKALVNSWERNRSGEIQTLYFHVLLQRLQVHRIWFVPRSSQRSPHPGPEAKQVKEKQAEVGNGA